MGSLCPFLHSISDQSIDHLHLLSSSPLLFVLGTRRYTACTFYLAACHRTTAHTFYAACLLGCAPYAVTGTHARTCIYVRFPAFYRYVTPYCAHFTPLRTPHLLRIYTFSFYFCFTQFSAHLHTVLTAAVRCAYMNISRNARAHTHRTLRTRR